MKKIITSILLASLAFGAFALPNLLNKEQFNADSINNISVSLAWENIILKETYDNSSIEVETYCNFKKYAPEISASGSTLHIESRKSTRSFFVSPAGLSSTVIVYIPSKKDFQEISIKTSSGDTKISRPLSAKSQIKISASSGDIEVEGGLFSDTVKVSATSGDVELFNIDADDFKVQTSSGDIKLKKFTGGTGSVEATSGSIRVDDFASEFADFHSSSGGITIKKLDCDYFDAQNTSGGISLELLNAPSATSTLQCSSGDIDLYVPMRAKFSVDVSCSSGTFRDKFNNNRMNPRNNYKMDYNGGGSTIKIRTSSGDITLGY